MIHFSIYSDKIGGKRRNLSVDSAFSPSPFKRPCTDNDNTLTTSSTPSSILMNLLTTGEDAHYQLRKKRHSHPQVCTYWLYQGRIQNFPEGFHLLRGEVGLELQIFPKPHEIIIFVINRPLYTSCSEHNVFLISCLVGKVFVLNVVVPHRCQNFTQKLGYMLIFLP